MKAPVIIAVNKSNNTIITLGGKKFLRPKYTKNSIPPIIEATTGRKKAPLLKFTFSHCKFLFTGIRVKIESLIKNHLIYSSCFPSFIFIINYLNFV